MAVNHYENFPVASLLLPARYRPAVRALYHFARSADDIADEGEASDQQRLAALDAYTVELEKIARAEPVVSEPFISLQLAIRQYRLPTWPLHRLLKAFKQDVVQKRYPNYPALLDYCAHSANPVGHLILHLYGAATPTNLRDADAICSALQLINFWQDIGIDWEKQRIYLPLDDLARFGIKEQQIQAQHCDQAWQDLMNFELERTRSLMLSGSELCCRLPGRLGLELRMVVQGGLRILEKIEQRKGNVFAHRPKLGRWDWLVIGWRALRMKRRKTQRSIK